MFKPRRVLPDNLLELDAVNFCCKKSSGLDVKPSGLQNTLPGVFGTLPVPPLNDAVLRGGMIKPSLHTNPDNSENKLGNLRSVEKLLGQRIYSRFKGTWEVLRLVQRADSRSVTMEEFVTFFRLLHFSRQDAETFFIGRLGPIENDAVEWSKLRDTITGLLYAGDERLAGGGESDGFEPLLYAEGWLRKLG